MKKYLGGLVAMLVVVGLAYAVPSHFTETLPSQALPGSGPVSNGYDWTLTTSTTNTSVPFALPPYTLAFASNTLVASSLGQLITCTNCSVTGQVCFSTGTTATRQFVQISSPTNPCQ